MFIPAWIRPFSVWIALMAVVAGTALPISSQTEAAGQPACDWTGVWDSTFLDDTGGPEESAVIVLIQEGDLVHGRYDYLNGFLAGAASGPIVSGTWMQSPAYRGPDDSGEFEFTISADCRTFTGLWRYTGDTLWSAWDGARRETARLH